MKHTQNTLPSAQKAAPKTVSAQGAHKGQSKNIHGNGHTRDGLVRLTAYSFYEARHGIDGSDLDDWLRAEAHVDQLAAQSTSLDAADEVSPRAGPND